LRHRGDGTRDRHAGASGGNIFEKEKGKVSQMSATITVFGRASSSNVQAVMWGMAELGLSCERLDYGHAFGGLDSAEFRAMSPHGLVPVMRDGDLVVWESCAILRYLAAQYGDGGAFWPTDPAERAGVDMWAEWGKTTFARDFTAPIFWSRVRTPAKDRDAAALDAALARFSRWLDILEAQLSNRDYVCGDALSLADIVIGHVLYRYYDIDIPRGDHSVARAYYDRLALRPAYRDHVMLSYDMLRAKGA
jgi:glutathione S-transferase